MYCHIHHCHYHHCHCVPKDSKEKGGALTQEELLALTQEMKEELKDYTVDLKDQIFSYIDIGVNPAEINNSINSLKEQDTYILRTLTNKIDELNNTTNLSMFSLRARVANLEGQSATIIQDLADRTQRIVELENDLSSLPFEDGVLDDTFLVVDGFINQRQVNTGVDSIAALVSLNPNTSRVKVTVNSFYQGAGYGGGIFIWDSAKDKSTADGGTIIDPTVASSKPPTKAGIKEYLTEQGTGVGEGCWVLQYKDAVSFDQFGLAYQADSDAFVIDHTSKSLRYEKLKLYTESSADINIEGMTAVLYHPCDFKGDVYLKHTNSSLGYLHLADVDEVDNADFHNVDGFEDLKNNQNTLPFLTSSHIGRYIKIVSKEKIVRYQSYAGFSQYYYKIATAQIMDDRDGKPFIYPPIPFDILGSNVTEVLIYKPRERLKCTFKSLTALNDDLTSNPNANGLLHVSRINVDVEIGNMTNSSKSKRLGHGVRISASGCTISCGSMDINSTAAYDNYGIILNTCTGTILSKIKGGNIAGSFSSNTLVDDCILYRADDHFGNRWKIKNSKIDRISFAGKDLTVSDNTEYSEIMVRGDTPKSTGLLKLNNCTWKPILSNKCIYTLSSLGGNVEGSFPYTCSMFENIQINNLTVDLSGYLGSNAILNMLTFPTDRYSNVFKYPESVTMTDIKVINAPARVTGMDLTYFVHISKQPVNYDNLCYVTIKDIKYLSSHSFTFGLAIAPNAIANAPATIEDISQNFSVEISNVDSIYLSTDGRFVPEAKVSNIGSLYFKNSFGGSNTGAYKTQNTMSVFNSTLPTQVLQGHSLKLNLINTLFAGEITEHSRWVANDNSIILQKGCYALLGATGYKTPLDSYIDENYYITTTEQGEGL